MSRQCIDMYRVYIYVLCRYVPISCYCANTPVIIWVNFTRGWRYKLYLIRRFMRLEYVYILSITDWWNSALWLWKALNYGSGFTMSFSLNRWAINIHTYVQYIAITSILYKTHIDRFERKTAFEIVFDFYHLSVRIKRLDPGWFMVIAFAFVFGTAAIRAL